MSVLRDEWLGIFLGKPAYHITIDDLGTLHDGRAFFDVKIPVDDISSVIKLNNHGFFLVDTSIQLVRPYGQILTRRSIVRFAQAKDEIEVRWIARNSFRFDRFHQDPEINDVVASEIKEAWIGNFFSGRRGNWLVVAEYAGQVIGFALLICNKAGIVIIDLIAVSNEHRGKGVARDMISFVTEECLKPGTEIWVGTQVANMASLALYGSLGFRMQAASYVFHFHQEG